MTRSTVIVITGSRDRLNISLFCPTGEDARRSTAVQIGPLALLANQKFQQEKLFTPARLH
jgi:hypothetical protein